jgi:putative membrane protein
MNAKIRTGTILFTKGMVIGAANIIPGVSGGTLALVLGIYDKLIEAISNILIRPGKRKEYAVFLATVFAGAGSAVVLLANLMTYLLANHYQVTVFAFMGLIAGGIPAIWRAHPDMKTNGPRAAAFLIGAALVIIPTFMDSEAHKTAMANDRGVPEFGPAVYITLLVAGFLAGGGMIVPGISGSFILVLMGQYGIIMSAIKGFVVAPLFFIGAGAATGILVFSKLIDTALKKMPAGTYYFILGLVMASLWIILPGTPTNATTALAGGVVFLAGGGLAYYMSRLSA